MTNPTHTLLPIAQQCQLLTLPRSTAYYQPEPVSETDLAILRCMDELHLEHPYAGARLLRDLLRRGDYPGIGRKRVRTLMNRLGIEALYRKPNTSKRHPRHPVYPYLLRDITLTRPNHVWAADIIPAFAGTGSTFR